MTNCPNCGAPITGSTCEYCGTVFPRRYHSDDEYTLLEAKNKCLEDQKVIKELYDSAIFAMRAYSSGIFTENEARKHIGLSRR